MSEARETEPAVLPPPLSVAEILAKREENPDDYAHVPEGYLAVHEVRYAWPVVWMIAPVAEANDVRIRTVETYGTWGGTSWRAYQKDDVQRVADAIAAGTAVVEPRWRRDTVEGRAAIDEFKRNRGHRRFFELLVPTVIVTSVVLLLVLLFAMGS
ncbi:hypothetical protein [Luedemannella helvata]|uniref:Uncharacterized protein n=1 Tax=Luedemannella helvata TaxID=349315 RepID=A0ABP4VQ33_9ACTN